MKTCAHTKTLYFPGSPVIKTLHSLVVKSLPANAGDMGSSPGLERFHMPQKQLSPRATTTEPARLEPTLNKKSHCNEKLAHLNEE